MAGCPCAIEVTAVLLAAVDETARQTGIPIHERGNKMGAKKTAAKVLAESREPMRAKEIVEQMTAKRYGEGEKERPPFV